VWQLPSVPQEEPAGQLADVVQPLGVRPASGEYAEAAALQVPWTLQKYPAAQSALEPHCHGTHALE
jgi:hypothetical protein